MAEVFKRKYKNKLSETYFFKSEVNGKRRNINTKSTNRREAGRIAKQFIERGTIVKARIGKPNTIVAIIEENGWMVAGHNPKYKLALSEKRNYGITQAKNIASSFNNMFNKIGDLEEWKHFILTHRVLKNSYFDYYETFVSKPAHSLTIQDAINFITFLEDYTAFLKKDPLDKGHKYFMRQNKMNIVALKSFYTFTVDVIKDKRVPENIFAGRVIPVNKAPKEKNFFTMEQIKIMFNDNFARRVDFPFAKSHVYRALKFAALTGMRSGEVRALQHSQFDRFYENVLRVDKAFKENVAKKSFVGKPKWDKVRTIYLCDSVLECRTEPHSSSGFVFCSNGGYPIPVKRYIENFKEYLENIERVYNKKGGSFLNGKKYTPHSLRGGLNSYLLSLGDVGTHLIQEYFGWTKQSLTQVQQKHYTKFQQFDSFMVAKAIEKGFSGREMYKPSLKETDSDSLTEIMNQVIEEGKKYDFPRKYKSQNWGLYDEKDLTP